MFRGLLLAACACAAFAPAARAQPERDLRAELLRMRETDVAARKAAIAAGFQDQALNERMTETDRANTKRLKELVDAGGWPRRSAVGDDGAEAAWLIAQHADLDPAFQARCLALMEALLPAGEVRKQDVAFLTDRVLRSQGKPQRYGTQMHEKDGEHVPDDLEDPVHLDDRRAAIGLSTEAENIERMKREYGPAKK